MRSFLLLVLPCVVACGGPSTGAPVKTPTPGPAVATAKASEPGGIVVLANGEAGNGEAGLLATTQDELADLWGDVGLSGSAPRVDFATHVVVGTNFWDGPCQPELVAATVDAAGTLTFTEQSLGGGCIRLAVRIARVVAVPRSILPPKFTWRARVNAAYAFELGSAK